jgi:hypothetical protein
MWPRMGHEALGGSTGIAGRSVLLDGLQQQRCGDLASISRPVCLPGGSGRGGPGKPCRRPRGVALCATNEPIRSARPPRLGGADAPGGASSRPEPGAGSAGRGAAQRRLDPMNGSIRQCDDPIDLTCSIVLSDRSTSCGVAAAGSGHYARLQPWTRFSPAAWNGSWNDTPNNPSVVGAVSAMTCAICAGSAHGARGRTSCKRLASGSNPLTGSQFSRSLAVASTLIVERRRVVTPWCRSSSLP